MEERRVRTRVGSGNCRWGAWIAPPVGTGSFLGTSFGPLQTKITGISGVRSQPYSVGGSNGAAFGCLCTVYVLQQLVKCTVVHSAGLRLVLLMLQHYAHSGNTLGPRPRARKREKFFSVLVVISVVGTFSGKLLQLLPLDIIF